MNNDDLLDHADDTPDETKIKVVYPYGCSLNSLSSQVSTLFTSGLLSYPVKRPLMLSLKSLSKKGKMIILGSERFMEDEFFEKEDNKKIIVSHDLNILGYST